MPAELAIDACGEELLLLGERAAHWPRRRALIVADVHLGKASAYREQGMPVPEGDTVGDLERLGELLAKVGAGKLIVVGDLFHDAPGRSGEAFDSAFRSWRERLAALRILLVPGNHDAALDRLPAEWGIEVTEEVHDVAPFRFIHDPARQVGSPEGIFHLSGHLHPAVALGGGRIRSLKAPCFWVRPDGIVLPSFGTFTGSKEVRLREGDTAYAVAEGQVLEVAGAILKS